MRATSLLVLLTACAPTGLSNTTTDTLSLSPCVDSKTNVYGIDASSAPTRYDPHWTLDWNALHRDHPEYRFAFIRHADGEIDDTRVDAFWPAAKANGFLRSAYFFYNSWISADGQADTWVASLAAHDTGELPPMVDVEECTFGYYFPPGQTQAVCDNPKAGSAGPTATIAGLRVVLARLQKATGRTPIIYTDRNTWDGLLGSPDFSQYTLYIADPPPHCPALIAHPWSGWTFLQTAWKSDYDVDVFNGSYASLLAFANGTSTPPGPIGVQCVNNPGVGNNCGDQSVIAGGDPATLYHCDGAGPATTVASCTAGCQHNPPGVDDACTPPPSVSCVDNPGVGDNCGDEHVISGGTKDTLYHCDGAGAAATLMACKYGCVHQPPGVPDACAAVCVDNPGVGNNCGDQHVIDGGRADTLYHCDGAGPATILSTCTRGCKHNPPGIDDACN